MTNTSQLFLSRAGLNISVELLLLRISALSSPSRGTPNPLRIVEKIGENRIIKHENHLRFPRVNDLFFGFLIDVTRS